MTRPKNGYYAIVTVHLYQPTPLFPNITNKMKWKMKWDLLLLFNWPQIRPVFFFSKTLFFTTSVESVFFYDCTHEMEARTIHDVPYLYTILFRLLRLLLPASDWSLTPFYLCFYFRTVFHPIHWFAPLILALRTGPGRTHSFVLDWCGRGSLVVKEVMKGKTPVKPRLLLPV